MSDRSRRRRRARAPRRPVARLLAVAALVATVLPATAGVAQAQTPSRLGVPGAVVSQGDIGGPGLGPPDLGGPPQLSVADVSVDEDSNATVTVSLSGTGIDTVTVNYATSNGTATAGSDYTAATGSLSFAPGDASKSVTVTITDDSLDEDNETFTFTLSNASNATIDDSSATVTITDDDDPPVLSVDDVSVNENSNATVTVSLSPASGRTVTVNYATSDGTARDGNPDTEPKDYTQKSGSLTFSAGQTSKSVTVPINDDSIDEDNETFTFTLSNASNATTNINKYEATVTINDNDTASLSVADVSVNENSNATVTVSLSVASTKTVTVDYATSNGTATAGSDYTATSGTLTIPAGDTSRTVSVSISDDSLEEGDETFTFTLSNASNATIDDSSATVTITDNDAKSLSVAAVTVSEDNNATLTVRLSAASSRTVTVSYATSDGTATAGSDYTTKSGSLTFTVGQTSKSVTVAITDDNLDEDDETFTFTLSSASNATISGGQATVTINDNDTASLSVADVSVNEGAGSVTVTVSLSAESRNTVRVDYSTSDGTAKDGDPNTELEGHESKDYTATSGTLTFSPGDTSETATVTINNDSLDENNEWFRFTLSYRCTGNPCTIDPNNPPFSDSQATVTINDNDPPPSPRVTGATVKEGAGSVTLTVTLSTASDKTVTVDYATSDGTAKDGNPGTEPTDYTATSGTLTFLRGETSKTVSVPINSDAVNENNETFTFTVTGADNATGTASATVTIQDNPTLTVADLTVNENVGTATLTVSLDVAGAADVNVLYETSSNVPGERGANAGSDYTQTAGTLTVTAGQTSGTVSVPINDDTTDEWNETFAVNLSTPANNANSSISDNQATVTINDNDPEPSLSVDDVTGKEGTRRIRLAIQMSAESGKTVTVNYATSDGTATRAGLDYKSASGSRTFPPGQTTRTVAVDIHSDTVNENDETLTLTLSGASNASISDSQATVTIEDNPTLTVADVAVDENDGTATLTVSLDVAGAADVTVRYATSDGAGERGANAGSDYTATSGTLTVAAGDMSGTVSVPISEDTTDEWNETFTFTLSNPANASISDSQATVTINDNDPEPSLSVADVAAAESSNAPVEVTLSAASGKTVTVNYATSNGTAETDATSGSDYTAASGTLTFSPGQTSKTVTVSISEDTTDEWNETFTFTLSSASNATFSDSSATVTINDNDPEPSLSVTGGTVSEGIGNATVRVRLSAASGRTVTVNYATSNGTATAPGDYTATSGTLTYTPGQTSKTVTVPIVSDTVDEDDETFTFAVTGATNATGTPSATITIGDNPTLSLAGMTVYESAETAVFTLTLDAAGAFELTVDYATHSGTATAPGDYTRRSGTLTIPAGTLSRTVAVPIIDDSQQELDEEFTLRLSNPTNASISVRTAEALIIDNDAPDTVLDDDDDDGVPRLTIGDAAASEGGVASFPVALSSASDEVVVVDYATAAVTAEAGADYVARRGRLTIPPGRTTGTIQIRVRDDRIDEPEETFSLRIVGATNARRPSGPATGTIRDDDAPPVLTVSDVTASEDAGVVEFTVVLSTPSARFVTAAFRTVGGTATAGADYTATSGTLIVPPGWASVVIRVPISDDQDDERDETFTLRLRNARNATLGAAAATATIADDDGLPNLAVADAGATEGAGAVTFTVTLSEASATDVSASYFTTGGTAWTGVDFRRTAGRLTIAAGETTAVIRVPVLADRRVEPAETFTLTLARAVGAVAPLHRATGTIVARPTLRVAPATASEGDGAVTFTVTLDAVSHEDISVDYATSGGTATSGVDFRRTAGTLEIPAGETTAVIRVPVVADRRVEPAESFTLTLRSPRNAGLGVGDGDDEATTTGTISDDDGLPRLSVADVTASEGDGAITFTVVLNGAARRDVSVSYATAAGTASRYRDFTPVRGRLTIPAGSAAATIRVPIADDSLDEPTETFTLTLSAPRNAALGDGAASTTATIVDDDGPPVAEVGD